MKLKLYSVNYKQYSKSHLVSPRSVIVVNLKAKHKIINQRIGQTILNGMRLTESVRETLFKLLKK